MHESEWSLRNVPHKRTARKDFVLPLVRGPPKARHLQSKWTYFLFQHGFISSMTSYLANKLLHSCILRPQWGGLCTCCTCIWTEQRSWILTDCPSRPEQHSQSFKTEGHAIRILGDTAFVLQGKSYQRIIRIQAHFVLFIGINNNSNNTS